MTKRFSTLIFFCFVFTVVSLSQQYHELLDSKTREMLHEALSGELAKEHVIQITRHHRIQGSRGYRDAAQYVLQQLRKYGFSEKDAYIESFKSDGKIVYQTWQSPSGWDISSAELRMIEPYDERIVGYPEIAMSVMTYSNAGDVTAELAWVGRGTSDEDYKGKDVKGKIVLATGYGGSVHRLAVLKYGAKAVVCYLDDSRAKEYPDMLQYTGMWPRTEELDRVTFGFNLTNRQGEKLKSLLDSGKKVVLRGTVNGIGLESYFMDVVVAHIRGSEKSSEELVFSAHLDHPKESANDNASGSGAILDIARTLKELIDAGKLQRPQRSFRFIWVPEFYGTMAYIDAHPELKGPELGGTFLANMNMDMVGENTELLHSKLILTRTPASLPSCVNDVVENMAAMVDGMNIRTPRGSLSEFNYRMTPYSGGSDHMMFIDRKIPGIMFSHDPDYTHHTSEDTPDKVDPVELERCEIIATGTMLYLANLTNKEAIDLAYLVHGNSSRNISLKAGTSQENGTSNAIIHAGKNGADVLQSITSFNSSNEATQLIKKLTTQLKQQSEFLVKTVSSTTKSDKADNRIPVRLTRGPLDSRVRENKLDAARAAWYESADFTLNGDEQFELVNFIDGKRNISAIQQALAAEFGKINIEVVSQYVEDLVTAGVVKWK